MTSVDEQLLRISLALGTACDELMNLRKSLAHSTEPGQNETAPIESVPLARFKQLTGITPKAVYQKIARGDWLEGYEFHRSATGAITVYLPGYHRWAQGKPRERGTP